MPRIARKLLCGEFFHIIVKGLNNEYIFKENEYKKEYIKLLKEKINAENVFVIAYCIMGNHAHILLCSKDFKEVSEYMRKVNTSYGIFYNRKKGRVGYVFKGRFYTKEIKDKEHLLLCIAYIHNNPVKANIVNKEEYYNYSSYNEYFGNSKNIFVNKKALENIFEKNNGNNIMNSLEKCSKIINSIELEIEFEEEIDYNKIIKEYKKKYNDKEIIYKLVKELKISKNKVAKLMKTTVYNVNKILKNAN